MKRHVTATAFDLLDMFVNEMERRGENKDLVYMDINEQLAKRLADTLRRTITIGDLQRLTDQCLANQWLTQPFKTEKYLDLAITTDGLGIVRSRRRKKEVLGKRSTLRKVSDYLEERKGLISTIGVVIALASFLGFAEFLLKIPNIIKKVPELWQKL